MYATCTFCHRALGSNETIELFPVGKRLAFDASKGRLWVVCPHCAQWNLTPLDERWEAIEGAEQLFRESKLRHSTDNIGLAKLRDGTELVRIGNALRPEMAAWRYGQNFVRRWTGQAAGVGAGAAVFAGSALLLPAGLLAGMVAGSGALVAGYGIGGQMMRMGGRVAFMGRTILDNEHQFVQISPKELCNVRLIAHECGWALRVPYLTRRSTNEQRWSDQIDLRGMGFVTIRGQPAVTAARQLLPIINGFGARKTVASDGELADLERAWKDAEEVAGISDGLMIPGRVQRALDQLRGRNPLV